MKYFDGLRGVGGGVYRGERPSCTRALPHYALKLLEEGAGSFARDGGPARRLRAPALFWQAPGIEHTWGPAAGGWTIRYVQFAGPRAEALFRDGFDALTPEGVLPLPHAEPIRTLLRDADAAVQCPGGLEAATLLPVVERILLAACRAQTGGDAVASALNRGIDGLVRRMAERPGAEVDVAREAETLGYSYGHFRRAFRARTGVAPQEYLIRCRIREVARALVDGDRPIKQIVREAGYADLSHFGRLFRNRTGLSPVAYRREHRRV